MEISTTGTERKERVRRLTQLDEWLDEGFQWVTEHARGTVSVLAAGIAAAAIAAGIYEHGASRQAAAQTALGDVDREIERTLAPGAEPANEETATRLREKALADYEAVIRDHAGTFGSTLAVLRAAGMEIDLGRLEPAEKRLAAAAASWPENAPERAVALRLRGYALERLDRLQDAAEAYAQAAAVTEYPGRAGSYVQAGDTFARIGANQRAIEVYEALTLVDPAFAERSGVLERLEGLRAVVGTSKPSGAAPAAAGAAEAKPAESAPAATPKQP